MMSTLAAFIPPELSDTDFSWLAKTLEQRTGIAIPPEKKGMVQARLARRLRELGLRSFTLYCERLRDSNDELGVMVRALTTNHTSFFREPHHFTHLEQVVFPQLLASGRREIRLWSAACSMGQEPYTLAMVARHWQGLGKGVSFTIHASDIDSDVLNTARAGRYPAMARREIPEGYLPSGCRREGDLQMPDDVRQMVRFTEQNLFANEPPQPPFDAIFCRNVLIYFEPARQEQVLKKLVAQLRPGGKK